VLLARKREAERERQRAELQRSREFMEKVAAEEAAALRDMEQRARALESKTTAAARPAKKPSPAAVPAKSAAVAPATAQPATVAKAPASAGTEPAADLAAQKAACTVHVSELSTSGRLTYADVARMQGVRKDDKTGHLFTPPVKAQGGRAVSFEVMPTGCVRVVRTAGVR